MKTLAREIQGVTIVAKYIFQSVVVRLLAALIVWLLLPVTARAQRAIPDDNLAYPVMVVLSKGGMGSGFYLNTPTAAYLVTAKHVLFHPVTGELLAPTALFISYPSGVKETGRNVLSANLAMLLKNGEVKPHPNEDVAIVRVATVDDHAAPDALPKERRVSLISGIASTEMTESGITGVATENTKKFDEVLIANSIVVLGYPTSLGLKEIPQLDQLRPLLRNGIIAGTNPGRKLLVIDCPVYPGNSGGPVIEISQQWPQTYFRVIGAVSEFVPFDSARFHGLPPDFSRSLINSGYGIVTPMDYVLELVK
jgi:hypothetical protein